MNVNPAGGSAGGELNLNVVKTSKIVHVSDTVLKPKKET